MIKHYFVHAFGLMLSLSAIVHTMSQFSDDPLFRLFFSAGGVFAGLSIQYLWGRAAAHRSRNKRGDIARANLLVAIVIICIVIFDFLSAFTVLLTQIDKGDTVYTEIANTKKEIETEIGKLEKDIEKKKSQQEAEFDNKGRGPKYDKFQSEIDKLEAEVKDKKAALAGIKIKVNSTKKSIFTRLEEKSGIPGFWIQFVWTMALMFLIYFVPLLTPWKIKLDDTDETVTDSNAVTPNPVKPQPAKYKPVTADKISTGDYVTPSQPWPRTDETENDKLVLCACGCGRYFPFQPRNPGKQYFDDSCRVRDHRRKKAEERLSRMRHEGVKVL